MMDLPPDSLRIYLREASDLIRYATALVGPSHAEDAVADAMAKVLPTVDLARLSQPRAYLFRCVLNQVRQDQRRHRSRQRRERLVGMPAAESAPPASALDELGLLSGLSVRERAVVYLTYWEDLPVAGVAEVLGIGDGSVRRYLARARSKLRTRLEQERRQPAIDRCRPVRPVGRVTRGDST